MIENIILFITLFVLGTVVMIFDFLYMTFSFNKTGSNKYNFLTFLPFELNPFKRYQKKTYIYTIIQFFGSLLLCLSLYFYMSYYHQYSFVYVISSLLIINVICFNFLTFIKMSNFKMHLSFAVAVAFLNLLIAVLEFLFLTNNNIIIYNLNILCTIVICVIILFIIILIMNPTIKKWYKMVQVDAQTYSRPKYNYLAMLEWGSFLSLILLFIPLILTLF